jgi:hypothetical protein
MSSKLEKCTMRLDLSRLRKAKDEPEDLMITRIFSPTAYNRAYQASIGSVE